MGRKRKAARIKDLGFGFIDYDKELGGENVGNYQFGVKHKKKQYDVEVYADQGGHGGPAHEFRGASHKGQTVKDSKLLKALGHKSERAIGGTSREQLSDVYAGASDVWDDDEISVAKFRKRRR